MTLSNVPMTWTFIYCRERDLNAGEARDKSFRHGSVDFDIQIMLN